MFFFLLLPDLPLGPLHSHFQTKHCSRASFRILLVWGFRGFRVLRSKIKCVERYICFRCLSDGLLLFCSRFLSERECVCESVLIKRGENLYVYFFMFFEMGAQCVAWRTCFEWVDTHANYECGRESEKVKTVNDGEMRFIGLKLRFSFRRDVCRLCFKCIHGKGCCV